MTSTTSGSVPPSSKILTVGAVAGSIRDFFTKIKAIDAKHGKFDFVLCVGDFFGPPVNESQRAAEKDDISDLLEGRLEAPLECYIMQGEYPLPDDVIEKFAKAGGELCKNVFMFNKSGFITTAQGLRIACLGGKYNADLYNSTDGPPGFASPFFNSQTVDRLLANTLNKGSTTSKTTKNQDYTSLAAIRSGASSSQLIDVLITQALPASITTFSSAPPPQDLTSSGAKPIDDIVRHTKPRYHFVAGGGSPPKFWEREPFLWDDESWRSTRFLSLGAFGGNTDSGKKQRWFYAFSIAPQTSTAQNSSKPAKTTENPFTRSAPTSSKRSLASNDGENYIFGNVGHSGKRARIDTKQESGKPPSGYKCRRCESTEHFITDCPERTKPPEGYVCRICETPGHLVRDCPTKHAVGDTGGKKPRSGYVCRACGSEAHYIEDCLIANQRQPGRGGRKEPPKEIKPDECWFCLSNPNLAKHLIVSIGSECYLTLPKGQLIPTQSTADTPPLVPGGGHLLIVPITHYPTLLSIPPDLAPPILEETDRYKGALRAMFAKHGAVPVFFEVGRITAKGGHAHVQVVPIPKSLQDKVENIVLEEGRMQGVDFESDPDAALQACADGGSGYFRVDLPDGRTMVHLIKHHIPFSIQFGRQVLASLLGIPERMDWKACMLMEDEDKADAQEFKTAFALFDPTR